MSSVACIIAVASCVHHIVNGSRFTFTAEFAAKIGFRIMVFYQVCVIVYKSKTGFGYISLTEYVLRHHVVHDGLFEAVGCETCHNF